GSEVHMLLCELSSMADVARIASEISTRTERISVLINNAGGPCKERIITPEGTEATFAGNYLGHFLLTKLLLPSLHRNAEAQPAGCTRILNVSSVAHEYSEGLDWDDLQSIHHF